MLMRRAIPCSLLFCLLGCLQCACSRDQRATSAAEKATDYKCQQAKDADRPRGGNFVLAGEGEFKAIYGTALSKDERTHTWPPLGDVVVELYSYSGGVNQEEVSKAVRGQKRVAACLTGDGGQFSFPGLTPGRYLLRAGSRASDKYDEVHAILTIDPSRPLSALKILLGTGT
jgi:hypothetical protein